MSQRPPLRVVSFAIPVLAPREAEAVIDLLEQIQGGVLWDAYGEAIVDLDAHDDPANERELPEDPDDLPRA